jgi:tubulin polyglutamylase TTLL1
MPESK